MRELRDEGLTQGDRIVMTWMLLENGASRDEVDLFLRILGEGIRRGEEDSLKARDGFRMAARNRDDGFLDAILDLDLDAMALEAAAAKLDAQAVFLEEAAALRPSGDEVADRLAIRSLMSKLPPVRPRG